MQLKSTMMQDLFDAYKKQLLEKIDGISIFDDPEEYSAQWQEVNEMVVSIDRLMDIRQDLGIESSTYFPPVETKEIIPEIIEPEEKKEHVFEFKRKLRGGVVVLDSGDYFLPEQMVRDMGLSDGDLVRSSLPYMHENRVRRNFTIVDKKNGDNPDRVQLTEFVVEKTDRGLCLEKDIYGNPHHLEDGTPYTACLSHSDILDYNIKPGDIVDAAYYKNNTEGVSLIFKHSKASKKDYSDFHVLFFPKFGLDRKDMIWEQEQALTQLGFNLSFLYGTEMDATVKQEMRKAHVLVIDKKVQHTKIAIMLLEHFTTSRKPILFIPDDTRNITSKIREMDNAIRKQL